MAVTGRSNSTRGEVQWVGLMTRGPRDSHLLELERKARPSGRISASSGLDVTFIEHNGGACDGDPRKGHHDELCWNLSTINAKGPGFTPVSGRRNQGTPSMSCSSW